MGANGKWEFLIPVALAAAGLLGTTPVAADATSDDARVQALAKDDLLMQVPADSGTGDHLQHASHQSHRSHRSHQSHYSSYAPR